MKQRALFYLLFQAFDPEVTVVFNKQLKETKNLPDKIIQLGDFIEVKGMKAQEIS